MTFAGIPKEYSSYDKSQVVLLPVPYDATSTWGKGADKGPEAFLEAAENMELYDIETLSEVYKKGIYLSEPLDGFDTPDDMVEKVHQTVKQHLLRSKFVTLFGGEHSISIGSIRAFNQVYKDLTVLQIDAHADLRSSYNGTPYNHACAMYEANESSNLVQVGIRSMDRSETTIMHPSKVFFAHEMAQDDYWIDVVLETLTNTVYITFDFDALDPAIMPATGTPEPGGLLWYETLELLKRVFLEKNVVGFDLVELCPIAGLPAPNFLAAKLYYKMLSYKFELNDE